MSAYIQFFVKIGEKFAPIATYSRSNTIYQSFQYAAPWEKIRPVTKEVLANVCADIDDSIENSESTIRRVGDQMEWLKGAEGSFDERMEQLHDLQSWREEVLEGIEEYKDARSFCGFLRTIIEEAETEEGYSENPLDLHSDSYVFVGIEVGNPTIKDIEA